MYGCNSTILINYISITNKVTYSYKYNSNYIIIRIRKDVLI